MPYFVATCAIFPGVYIPAAIASLIAACGIVAPTVDAASWNGVSNPCAAILAPTEPGVNAPDATASLTLDAPAAASKPSKPGKLAPAIAKIIGFSVLAIFPIWPAIDSFLFSVPVGLPAKSRY